MKNILYLVIPCYNEEEVLYETSKQLKEKINSMIEKQMISNKSRIMFVNDGSKDKTWEIIQELHSNDSIFSGVNLSRNRGHQNALLAGLMTAKNYADVTISLDADLQDDIHVIDKFVEKYLEGYDIVYGVRNARTTDTWFKRNTALAFYKFQALMGVQSVYNHADYRLMSKRALEALSEYKEVNLFLRGMVPLVGFKSCNVEYARNERFAGESKYPLKKMLAFAWDGITSFSIKPIRFVTMTGFLIFIVSLLIIIYSLIRKIMGYTVTGWTFLACSIWVLGGIQLLGLGIIGEYIGKIYNEVKQRPRFIIEDIINE
ncbi:glycosyltransferase family 2 protein [[Eubacterium] hominis]|uniref:glycosyltransferase family 2 protein n=1 Tax=[Eubacterium] hominis TaxID=2764325 RepID=UPI003A4D7931